jgi:hypothetical protein
MFVQPVSDVFFRSGGVDYDAKPPLVERTYGPERSWHRVVKASLVPAGVAVQNGVKVYCYDWLTAKSVFDFAH